MSKYASKKLYGEVVAGPGGDVMPEAIAQLIEKRLPSLPEECRKMGFRRLSYLPKGMEIQEGERADISFISTDAVDRDFEVLIPGGADFKQFKKNPVVTFAHNYSELPVGRALWVKRSKDPDGWLAKTQYTTKPDGWEGPWFPDAVFHLVKSGDLAGKSVGFIPTEMSAPTEKEIVKRPEMASVGTVIRKWLVLEYAVAPVQSNPDALMVAVGKAHESGIVIPEAITDEMGILIPTGVPALKYEQEKKPEVIVVSGDVEIEETVPVKTRGELLADAKRIVDSVDITKIVEDSFNRLRGGI